MEKSLKERDIYYRKYFNYYLRKDVHVGEGEETELQNDLSSSEKLRKVNELLKSFKIENNSTQIEKQNHLEYACSKYRVVLD